MAVELLRWGMLWAVFFLIVGLFEEFLFRGYIQFTLADMGFWPAAILFSAIFWRLHMSNRVDGIGFWLAAIWLSLILGRVHLNSQGGDAKGIGFWPAAILLSLLFGRVHLENPGEGWVGACGSCSDRTNFPRLPCAVPAIFGCVWGGTRVLISARHSFTLCRTAAWSSRDICRMHPCTAPNGLTGGTVGPEGSVFSFLTMGILAVAIHLLFPRRRKQSPRRRKETKLFSGRVRRRAPGERLALLLVAELRAAPGASRGEDGRWPRPRPFRGRRAAPVRAVCGPRPLRRRRRGKARCERQSELQVSRRFVSHRSGGCAAVDVEEVTVAQYGH